MEPLKRSKVHKKTVTDFLISMNLLSIVHLVRNAPLKPLGFVFTFLLALFLSAQEQEIEDSEPSEIEPSAELETVPEPEMPISPDDSNSEAVIESINEEITLEDSGPAKVYIVPIEGAIATPTEYIVRRAVKDAIENDIDAIVLKMHTPGGALGNTLEIMELLSNFEGTTITFIDNEAISAGAYISASTQEIYMAPDALIGAAAVVSGSGEDIAETMKQKIDSVLKAKVRILSEEYRYRGDVIRAMMDSSFELKIGDEVIKEADELLSHTASEAVKFYGDPPAHLLAEGIYDDIDALLEARFGDRGFEDQRFEISWSEELAQLFNTITPAIIGIALLLIFIEFKTPGFGVFGILGVSGLVFVFFSQYVAGFAGYEPLIFFILGALLILVELFLIPGAVVFGVMGVGMMLGSLIWSMVDVWPTEDFSYSPAVFTEPLQNVGLGMLIAIVGFLILLRLLPKTSIWQGMVLTEKVGDSGGKKVANPMPAKEVGAIIGKVAERPPLGSAGISITAMMPSGTIEIEGKRFQAQTRLGSIEKGVRVRVSEYAAYSLVVEAVESSSVS